MSLLSARAWPGPAAVAFADDADAGTGAPGSSLTAAGTTPESDFEYKIGDTLYGYGAYVSGYTGASKEVVVPGKIEGVDVVYVSLFGAGLEKLDVSRCSALMYLDCYNNQLTSLNVSNNKAMTGLDCYGNQFTSLDVSNNVALVGLSCGDNQLTALDVSNNPALRYLYCPNNRLTSLDVGRNPALERLACYGNPLTSLDVSKNPALASLNCSGSQLTALDVSNNPALTRLYCYSNFIVDTGALEAWLAQEGHSGLVTPQNIPVLTVVADFGAWKDQGLGLAAAEVAAPFDDFIRLSLDGEAISDSDYTVTEDGSRGTVITLSEDYLKSLVNDTYAFQVFFTDGYADLTLVIGGQSSASGGRNGVPTAGDGTDALPFMAALPVSGLGLLGALLWRKRHRPE